MLVLIIPHSNAEEERVFSMVRKNKTAFRPALDPKGTLSSILTIKLAHTEAAHQFEPNKELLKTAKSATRVYITVHTVRNEVRDKNTPVLFIFYDKTHIYLE